MPPPLSEKIPKSLTNHIKDTMALGIIQNLKKPVLPVDKRNIFNISAQIEETETTVNFGQGLGNFRENRGNFNTREVKRKQSFLEK